MNPACSASLLMNDTDVRFRLLHTYMKSVWSSRCFQHKWGQIHEQHPQNCSDSHLMSIWPFHLSKTIVMSYIHRLQKPKSMTGSHGNLSKYKFGLAEYITVYVIQLQQLLQLLLRIITQYAKYVYFKFYKMFTECFWVISVLMLLLILLILLFI